MSIQIVHRFLSKSGGVHIHVSLRTGALFKFADFISIMQDSNSGLLLSSTTVCRLQTAHMHSLYTTRFGIAPYSHEGKALLLVIFAFILFWPWTKSDLWIWLYFWCFLLLYEHASIVPTHSLFLRLLPSRWSMLVQIPMFLFKWCDPIASNIRSNVSCFRLTNVSLVWGCLLFDLFAKSICAFPELDTETMEDVFVFAPIGRKGSLSSSYGLWSFTKRLPWFHHGLMIGNYVPQG